jgi:transketolase
VSAQSPTVIIAQTIKGKGLTKMENKLEWHYKSLSLEEIPAAIEELNNNA